MDGALSQGGGGLRARSSGESRCLLPTICCEAKHLDSN